MADSRSPELRSELRPRALKAARLIFNHRSSVMSCTVRNLSSKGAKLIVDSQVGLPNTFELVFEAGGEPRFCQVIWRRDGEVGVTFVKAGTAPG
jgi:hypothetical protein